MAHVLVTDFDGVIVRDSERFKTEAWNTIGASYGPDGIAAIREAEARFGRGRGGDRYDILNGMLTGLGVPETERAAKIQSEAQRFDALVQDMIAEAGADQNAVRALTELANIVPVYVNSATPVQALSETVTRLGIAHVFAGVLGRPLHKEENFRMVAEAERVEPADILFVGDSVSDAHAAEAFGCVFVGYRNEASNDWTPPVSFPTVTSLQELIPLCTPR